MKKSFSWFEGFSLDLRSLALFRIAFGSCLFLDIFYRMFYINDFYTDNGVIPREALVRLFLSRWESTLYLINGQAEIIFVLMAITLVCIAAFIVGFYTRVAAFLVWILMVSMQLRAQVVLHGGDDLIRVLLFWCQFVPLGAVYSVDQAMNPKSAKPDHTLLTFGSAGLVIQLMSMYLFTAALKWHPVWHSEGSAIYYALSLEQFTSPFGHWLLNFPEFMRMSTFVTLAFEFIGPTLVLLPWFAPRSRLWVALSYIAFHFGLFLCLNLGLFPWTCMAAWLMVLPSSFWSWMKDWKLHPFQWLATLFHRWKWSTPPAARVRPSLGMQFVSGVFILLIFAWNLSHHETFKFEKSEAFRIIMNLTATYQKWNMFAPYPRKDDGWYVVEATLFNGEKVNPFAEDTVYTEEKPKDVAATYKNTMWRKYLTNTWLKSYHNYREYFGRYLCRTWNKKQDSVDLKINTLKIFFMLEMNSAEGQPIEPLKKELLWRHYCFEKPKDWE